MLSGLPGPEPKLHGTVPSPAARDGDGADPPGLGEGISSMRCPSATGPALGSHPSSILSPTARILDHGRALQPPALFLQPDRPRLLAADVVWRGVGGGSCRPPARRPRRGPAGGAAAALFSSGSSSTRHRRLPRAGRWRGRVSGPPIARRCSSNPSCNRAARRLRWYPVSASRAGRDLKRSSARRGRALQALVRPGDHRTRPPPELILEATAGTTSRLPGQEKIPAAWRLRCGVRPAGVRRERRAVPPPPREKGYSRPRAQQDVRSAERYG